MSYKSYASDEKKEKDAASRKAESSTKTTALPVISYLPPALPPTENIGWVVPLSDTTKDNQRRRVCTSPVGIGSASDNCSHDSEEAASTTAKFLSALPSGSGNSGSSSNMVSSLSSVRAPLKRVFDPRKTVKTVMLNYSPPLTPVSLCSFSFSTSTHSSTTKMLSDTEHAPSKVNELSSSSVVYYSSDSVSRSPSMSGLDAEKKDKHSRTSPSSPAAATAEPSPSFSRTSNIGHCSLSPSGITAPPSCDSSPHMSQNQASPHTPKEKRYREMREVNLSRFFYQMPTPPPSRSYFSVTTAASTVLTSTAHTGLTSAIIPTEQKHELA